MPLTACRNGSTLLSQLFFFLFLLSSLSCFRSLQRSNATRTFYRVALLLSD